MKHLVIFLLFFISVQCKAQNFIYKNGFCIQGEIENSFTGKVYLQYPGAKGKFVQDSAIIKNSSFTFTGGVNGFYYATLVFRLKDTNSTEIIKEIRFGLENKKINIWVDNKGLHKNKITGNITEKAIANFYTKKGNSFLLDSIEKIKNTTVELKIDSIKLNRLIQKIKSVISDYCNTHPNNHTSTYLLFDNSQYFDDADLHSLLIKLSIEQQNSYFGKRVTRIITSKNLKHSQIGISVNNFKTIDFKGDSVTLYDKTKNGFVLFDFWASWCNPCRESSPLLQMLYKKYKKSGFEIVGISCDKEEDELEWRNAIEQDSIFYWTQILTSPPNIPKIPKRLDLLSDFKILSFPTFILVDNKNKIVWRIEGDGELTNKLKEVYGE